MIRPTTQASAGTPECLSRVSLGGQATIQASKGTLECLSRVDLVGQATIQATTQGIQASTWSTGHSPSPHNTGIYREYRPTIQPSTGSPASLSPVEIPNCPLTNHHPTISRSRSRSDTARLSTKSRTSRRNIAKYPASCRGPPGKGTIQPFLCEYNHNRPSTPPGRRLTTPYSYTTSPSSFRIVAAAQPHPHHPPLPPISPVQRHTTTSPYCKQIFICILRSL